MFLTAAISLTFILSFRFIDFLLIKILKRNFQIIRILLRITNVDDFNLQIIIDFLTNKMFISGSNYTYSSKIVLTDMLDLLIEKPVRKYTNHEYRSKKQEKLKVTIYITINAK